MVDVQKDLGEEIGGLSLAVTIHETLDDLARLGDIKLWARYFRERFKMIDVEADQSNFELLLEKAAKLARSKGFGPLAFSLERNLKEERGVNARGEIVNANAHETWRNRFKERMMVVLKDRGVEEGVFEEPSLPETIAYNQLVQDFLAQMERGDFFESIGALTVLESILHGEFAQVKMGLEEDFPEVSPFNRLYVDSHAAHDFNHYKELILSLEATLESLPEGEERDSARKAILNGAVRMAAAKKAFFDAL